WEAVMGENPSRFRSPDRPVEGVNWEDCQRFLARLNGMVEGLEARLPTEAEWELGCRAGTSGMTWLGDFEIRKNEDVPGLDGIAWYEGNSGGGTHPVAMKAANPNGLFDMLGNVCEWCSDWWGDDQPDGAIDPRGPEAGSLRVVRGGSWLSHARYVRAACRDAYEPSLTSGYLGLRLARGQATR
ncbi:MAG TPA: SUMF1/EgtB/PvdO family nonheme iron enzyme, partial [Myxococcaceae bacterium]